MSLPTPTPASTPATRPRRRRRLAVVVLGILIAIAYVTWPRPSPPLRVSPETTFITSPLLPDGRPDYVAYLNAKLSEGVTPENNAVVLLSRVAGGSSVPAEYREEYFRLLGIPVPGDEDKLITWDEYAASAGIDAERALELQNHVLVDLDNYDPQQHPEVQGYFRANDHSLMLLLEGIFLERFYRPIVEPPGMGLQGNNWMAPHIEDRECARWLYRLSREKMAAGDSATAVDAAVAIHRLGRHVASGPFSINLLVGFAIEGMGYAACNDLILSGQLGPQDIAHLRDRMNELPPAVSPGEALDGGERAYVLDLLCALHTPPTHNPIGSGPPISDYQLSSRADINSLLTVVNRRFDELRDVARIRDLRERRIALKQLAPISQQSRIDAQQVIRRVYEFFGKTAPIAIDPDNVLTELGPGLYTTPEEPVVVRRSLLAAAVDIADFRARHQRFPSSLSELVPDIATELPLDPWTGEPLRYVQREDGFTLYSVGPNGIDDGGRQSIDPGKLGAGDDIRFGLPPPAAHSDTPPITPSQDSGITL